MARINLTARNAILDAMKRDYLLLGSYREVGLLWWLSSGMVWKMMNKGYWPVSKDIQKIIIDRAREKGIEIVSRKRNRVELDIEISKEDLRAIRELSVKERTKALIDFIRGE